EEIPQPATTTISSLGDDLLREVFLRLPSLPSLVRAAITCRGFLRIIRSSPAFRRRFLELHPPPLLDLFLDIYDSDTPTFRPLRRCSDPDLAAAGRGDFLLTRLPDDDEGVAPKWAIRDCHDGYVVLVSYNTRHRAKTTGLSVLSASVTKRGARAAVFSSGTREWQISPWVDATSLQPGDDEYSTHNGILVNGFIYWTQASRGNARVLNITTLQFSLINLPPHRDEHGALTPGETKDGKLCIVCAVGLTLVIWSWRADDAGVERWMLEKTFHLLQVIDVLTRSVEHIALKILVILDGLVYFSAYYESDPNLSGWFLSFCLETSNLNKLGCVLHFDNLYPYIMAWPLFIYHGKLIDSTPSVPY
ncbi:hypothetical protein BRADI_3g32407v3, partial [Brachypodium distachyon]